MDHISQFRETMVREGIALRQPELARVDNYALEHRYAARLRELDGELSIGPNWPRPSATPTSASR
jgi:hypothetical protein